MRPTLRLFTLTNPLDLVLSPHLHGSLQFGLRSLERQYRRAFLRFPCRWYSIFGRMAHDERRGLDGRKCSARAPATGTDHCRLRGFPSETEQPLLCEPCIDEAPSARQSRTT